MPIFKLQPQDDEDYIGVLTVTGWPYNACRRLRNKITGSCVFDGNNGWRDLKSRCGRVIVSGLLSTSSILLNEFCSGVVLSGTPSRICRPVVTIYLLDCGREAIVVNIPEY